MLAPYKTPGTKEFAKTIVPFVADSNAIILAHHGTVTLGKDPEQAFWWTEVLDSYCRILSLASQIGPLQQFTPDQQTELTSLRTQRGFNATGT